MIFINRVITILIIFGILLPSFSFAQPQPISPPTTLEEVRLIGEKVLSSLSGILKKIWQEALKIWQKIANWFKKIWNFYFWPKISPWFEELKGELEKRKIIIKEEFPREKEELKEEVPKVSKSLWQRLKELIK